jgi:hypothetical protein
MPNTIAVKDAGGATVTIGCYSSAGQDVMANSIPVTIASNQTSIPVTTAASTDTITTGTIGALNANVQINAQANYTATVQILGTWVGTLSFQMSIDAGVTWNACFGFPVSGGTGVSSITANGIFTFATGGYALFRVIATAYTSGTANITIDASIAQNQIGAHVYGISPTGVAPTYAPVAVSGVDGGGLKRSLLTDTDGTTNVDVTKIAGNTVTSGAGVTAAGTQRVVLATDGNQATSTLQTTGNASLNAIATGTVQTSPSQIIVPPATFLITAAGSGAGNSVTAQIQPGGGQYAFSISLPATAAAALSMASSTTTLGSTVVAYTGTSPTIGSLVAGTGVAPGSYVVSVVALTSFTMSLPATAAGTNTLTCTGGNFVVQFEGSIDNASFSPITVIPRTVQTLTAGITSTQTIGLYTWQGDATTKYIRARLSSLTTITQVAMYIDSIQPNKAVRLPFISGVAANVPINTAVIPPIDVSDLGEITVDINAVTAATLSWKQSNDPLLAVTNAATSLTVSSSPNVSAISGAAIGTFRIVPHAQYFLAQNTTMTTSFTLAGVNGSVGPRSTSDSIAIGSLPTLATVTAIVGGNIASGTADAINKPLIVGGADYGATGTTTGLVRRALYDVTGGAATIGPGEVVVTVSLSSTNAGAPTDGTQAKTIFLPAREGDFFVGLTAIQTTSPTFQVEYSYDNINFTIMPMARIDANATASQFGAASVSLAPIVQVVGGLYRGKTYGAPYVRIHSTAGTSNFGAIVRFVPHPIADGSTCAPFILTAANTTESAGSTVGIIPVTAGVRTLKVPVVGSSKAQLIIDASQGTTGTNTVVLEGSLDNSTWVALTLQPVGGGATAASVSFTTAVSTPLAGGLWEADLQAYQYVRARASAVMTTTPQIMGAVRIVPMASNRISNGTATISTFTATTDTQILAANANRKTFTITNEGAGTLYVLLGAGTSSATNYSVSLASGDNLSVSNNVNQIKGIFGSAGTARVTENI